MYCRIRVQAQLDPSWRQRFEGLRIIHEASGATLLSGSLPDQAALHGILLQIVRLGLTLISLETDEARSPDKKGDHAENSSGNEDEHAESNNP
jgi:hypothetical protein